MTTPAELGESSTDRRSSRSTGTSPKILPSIRRKQIFLVLEPGNIVTRSNVDVPLIQVSCRQPTALPRSWKFFFEDKRLRSSMFRKSVLPPTFSWYVLSSSTPRLFEEVGEDSVKTMVAPSWDLMSSPIMGRCRSAKRFPHTGSLAINTGMLLMRPKPASRAHSA